MNPEARRARLQTMLRTTPPSSSLRIARALSPLITLITLITVACSEGEIRVQTLSETYTIDRIYRSMQGPMSTVALLPGDRYANPELLWITAYRAVIVGEDGESVLPQEFMCHANLDLDAEMHSERFADIRPGWQRNTRLFTLSQGQQEVEFPDGFGLPVMSDEPLSLTTQVLNLNLEGSTQKVRHRVTVDLQRDADQNEPMKALFSIHSRLNELRTRMAPVLADEKFDDAMAVLAGLRQPVDDFFDRVTVNCENGKQRVNRLKLLSQIRSTMGEIADFGQIEG